MTRHFQKDPSDPGLPDDLINRINPVTESYRVPVAEERTAFQTIITDGLGTRYGHMMRIVNTDDYRLHQIEEKLATIEWGAGGDLTAAEILALLQTLPPPLNLDVMYHEGMTVIEIEYEAIGRLIDILHGTFWGSTSQTQWVGDNYWTHDGLTTRDVNRVRNAGWDRALICTRNANPAQILVFSPWHNAFTEYIQIGPADGLPATYTCTDVVQLGEELIAIFADQAFHRFNMSAGGVPFASGLPGYICRILPEFLYSGLIPVAVINDMVNLGLPDPGTIIGIQWEGGQIGVGNDEGDVIIGYCGGLGAADSVVVERLKNYYHINPPQFTVALLPGDGWCMGLEHNGNKFLAVIGFRGFIAGPQIDSVLYMLDSVTGATINFGVPAFELVSNAPSNTIFQDICYAGDCFYIIDGFPGNPNQLFEYEPWNFCTGAPPTWQQRFDIPNPYPGGPRETPFQIAYDGHRNLFISYVVTWVPMGSVLKFRLGHDVLAGAHAITFEMQMENFKWLPGFADFQYLCNQRQGMFHFGSNPVPGVAELYNWGAQVRGQ